MTMVNTLIRQHNNFLIHIFTIITAFFLVTELKGNENDDIYSQEYRIGPGDVITVEILNHPEISGTFTIGPDGNKTLPVAGILNLAGLSRQEAADLISEALAPNYQTKIVAFVRIDEYNSNSYTILGGAEKPGTYLFSHRPHLIDLISIAGGISYPQQKPSGTQAPKPFPIRCTIVRDGEEYMEIDYSYLIQGDDLSLNIQLQERDIVIVKQIETEPLYIFGQVRSPGYYNLVPNMTLLDAITQAGGFTQDAAKMRIHVVHLNNYLHEVINFFDLLEPDSSLDVQLESGGYNLYSNKHIGKNRLFLVKIQSISIFSITMI